MAAALTLTDASLGRLRKGRVLQHKTVVDSVDFTQDGRFVLTAGLSEDAPHTAAPAAVAAAAAAAAPAPQPPGRGARIAIWDVIEGKNVLNKILPQGCVTSTAQFLPYSNFDIVAVAADRHGLIRVPVEVDSSSPAAVRPMTDAQLFQRTRNKKGLTEWTDAISYSDARSEFRSDVVVHLAVSPAGNILCTAGQVHDMNHNAGNTIKIWDARLNSSRGLVVGEIKVHGRQVPSLAFDPTGKIFACVGVARHGHLASLFDVRKMTSGPFGTLELHCDHLQPPYKTVFSPDGHLLACASFKDDIDDTTKVATVCIYDAYDGSTVKEVIVPASPEQSIQPCDIGFTPDSRYLYSGSSDCSVYFWGVDGEAEDTKPVASLQGHAMDVRAARWNPKYAFFASACQNVVFWIPDKQDMPPAD